MRGPGTSIGGLLVLPVHGAACNAGSHTSRESIDARIGTTIAAMAGHYRESLLMIEASDPSSCFVPALRRDLASLTTPAQ